uniref:NADH dehydrogenase subunit 6 n=1 Tax=Tropidocephala brunnipennis TaxID=2008871 RepID=A0A7S4YYV2_9HEMI|nr:NADH dehydrogenase subunit 6 [Tropidocephala brunnipennis]QBZ38053.1 NADH dehydrogenase subunit 6 [Tropidocephala brunnipennis]
MKFLIFWMTMNSLISMFMNHPISLGSILMTQSILTSMNLIFITKNSWYSMILFLTFSSGMMIMFMYMSSISSNEKFQPSIKMFYMIIILMFTTVIMKTDWNLILNFKLNEQTLMFMDNEEKPSIIKNISKNKVYLTILITMVILIVLIAISNLINSFEGPLKLTYELFIFFM